MVLGHNRYGKAEIRLLKVDRPGPRHTLHDLTVSVVLSGDLEAAHVDGDNAGVLPTDTQKNTVFAFAREHGVGDREDFALLLARHFVDTQPALTRARVSVEECPWQRLGDHSFAAAGQETRTATATYDGLGSWVTSGLRDLLLLSSTDSEFRGFARDRYTTLPEAEDRILSTSVTARWRHATTDTDWAASYQDARRALVESFADTYSRSLQQTVYAMGERVLASSPNLVEARLSLPNRHHLLVDLSPFGLDNPGEVFHVDDRPYGLIEATVLAEDAGDADQAW